jgi:hypothetical protein
VSTLAAFQEIQNERQEELLSLPNVQGVGFAHKHVKGLETSEPSIAVFVSQKLPLDMLRKDERIPSTINTFKTDVIETGVIQAGVDLLETTPMVSTRQTVSTREERRQELEAELLRARVRPVEGGYSVGHYQITAGTYATAVIDASAFPGVPQRYYVLSNNHVLANSNDARIGDPILQPGPYDGGTVANDTIARLSRFVPINFAAGAANYVDAAIAEGPFDVLDREIYWVGYARGAVAPALNMLVQKTGRTTNYTTGRITAINATVNVNYGGGRVARFVNQILTTNMSAGGDSGSLLLDMENRAVGLLFAGSSVVTVHNDIRYVQHLLGIRVA